MSTNSSLLFLSLLILLLLLHQNVPGSVVEGFVTPRRSLFCSSFPSSSFLFEPRRRYCPVHQIAASEKNDNETPPPPQQAGEGDQQQDLDSSKGLFKSIRNVAGKVALQVKGGGSRIVSTASGLAGKGGSGIQSAYSVTSTHLSNIAESSADKVVTTSNNIVELAGDLAAKGGSGIQSTISTTSARLSDIVELGSSGMNSVATNVVTIADTTTYNAGEIVRWIEGQAKGGADVANTHSKAIVLRFTGKKDYKLGDITKELLRRIAATEIDMNDIALLLKVLLTVGAGFVPVAKVLPITILLEMLNVSLEKQIGGKVLEILASSLDERFSVAFNNDDKFQMGDAVKRSAMSAILNFTGKDSYQDGDIRRAVANSDTDGKNEKQDVKDVQDDNDNNTRTASTSIPKTLNIRVSPEFEEWDDRFRKAFPQSEDLEGVNSSKLLDIAVAKELVSDSEYAMSSSADVSSKFCIFCGTKLPIVANFCSSCGERQP